MNSLNPIRVVLVEPEHPGNIGQAARAMKNMGLSKLCLVRPQRFPDKEAFYRASRADDIVRDAKVVQSLDEALVDCSLVFGASVRERIMPQTLLNPREAADKIIQYSSTQSIAILFGCEKYGLSNEDLERCQFQIKIPSVSDYSSLNLAAAVQVVTYEIRMAWLAYSYQEDKKEWHSSLATYQELEDFFSHLEKTMEEIKFLNPQKPRKMMQRFRQIFHRALLDEGDVNLLRGMLKAVERRDEYTHRT